MSQPASAALYLPADMAGFRDVAQALQPHANAARAQVMIQYFKTGPGEYGAGDVFLGVSVPQQRRIARRFQNLSLPAIDQLLRSHWHEHRLTGVFILSLRFAKADQRQRKKIVNWYLARTRFINNWDIVDASAPAILGTYLIERSKTRLYKLAQSNNIWERRIAIVATQALIRQGQFDDTFKLAERLLRDQHDLIHKAVGWMLREVGDRNQNRERRFLRRYAAHMPRTMLRYAIEKFPETERTKYLAMKQA